MAAPAQAVADFTLATRARDGAPEIRVADRHVVAHEAEVLAYSAAWIGFWLRRSIADACLQSRSNARYRVAQAFHLLAIHPEVEELGRALQEQQLDLPGRAIAMLGHDNVGDALLVGVWVVLLVTIDEQHHVGILF